MEIGTLKKPLTTHNGLFLLAFLLMLFFSIFSTTASAQTSSSKSLILSDNYSEHYLSPYLMRYSKEHDDLSAEEILAKTGIRSERSDISGSITLLNISSDSVWLSFDVMNRSSKAFWKIDFGNSFMGRFGLFDKATCYTVDKDTNDLWENEITEEGDIQVELPINVKSQVLVKLEKSKGIPVTLPLRLIHQDKNSSLQDNTSLIIALSLLIGMAFFFSALTLFKGNYTYLFFSLYYLILGGFLIVQNKLIMIDLPLIGSDLLAISFLAVATSGLMISRLFWNMEYSSRFADFAFYALIIFAFCCFMGGSIFDFDVALIKTVLLFGPSLFIFVLIPLVSIVQSQQGNDEATPFMLGWFILLFGICITIFSLSGIMQPVSTAINAYWYTLIPQTIFFVVAAKMKMGQDKLNMTMSKTLEINETDSIAKLRASKENTEQERLLKVIEQERRVLGELRKSEARRTEEMRKAKDEADTANRGKSAFLAVVSHEIRTPMTGIMGMVRLLLDSNLTREQKEYAQTIQDSSDAMLALLNDILDFEKIEQGKMAFENISFDLHRMVQGVSTLMNGHAAQKGIELKTKIGDELPRYIKGDPNRLRQVLLNLTGNAVKFTTEGQVTITAELMKKSDNGENFEIYFGVTDSGIGISEEAQKNLFNPFAQANSSISRKFGGTGLGLAISRGLVQGMGSDININSNEGEGSTFFFTLNMSGGQSGEASKAEQEHAEQAKTSKPLNILAVDDNDVNLKVIAGFLEKEEHFLSTASTGEEALDKINRETFDVILMDIEMPGMKGDEATKEMRKSDNKDIKDIPVIALTGNVMPDDIERFYNAGMNGTLAKPIDPEKLKSVIARASQGIFDNPDMQVKEVAPASEKPEDLTIDDGPNDEKSKITFEPSVLEVNQNNSLPETTETNLVLETDDTAPSNETAFDAATLDTLKEHIDKASIQDMLDDLKQKSAEIIEAMNEAIDKEDTETLSAKGHELKGMAGNFGLVEISKQAGEIETKAKTQPVIVLTSLVSPLPEMQKRAETALDQWLNQIEG